MLQNVDKYELIRKYFSIRIAEFLDHRSFLIIILRFNKNNILDDSRKCDTNYLLLFPSQGIKKRFLYFKG